MSRLVSREPRRVGYFYFSLKSFFTRVGFKWHQCFSTRQGCETVFFYVNSEKPACFDNLRECSSVRLLQVCQVWLQLLTKKCLLCLGQTKHRWLQLSLTQSQHPFSVTWEILDVGMEDGHRSWRWTATRYEVACVRLLDSRDIRASVWVFPTKSNAKIAIGWDELARSVSNKKKFNMRRFRARLKKRRFDEKCGTKWTSVGTHAETHITKIKQAKCSYSAFSSVQFIFI